MKKIQEELGKVIQELQNNMPQDMFNRLLNLQEGNPSAVLKKTIRQELGKMIQELQKLNNKNKVQHVIDRLLKLHNLTENVEEVIDIPTNAAYNKNAQYNKRR